MLSTPLICCSIGATTVSATVSALAPGNWPVTVMIGGAISGYCATGNRRNATPPRITNTIETTAAKIGRSMKKCEMRITASTGFCLIAALGRRGRRVRFLGLYLDARPGVHESVDDDAIRRRQTVGDDAQAAVELTE